MSQPTENPVYGESGAIKFLRLLGKPPAQTYFRTFGGRGGGANRSRKGADLLGFDAAALEADNQAGNAVYVVVGNATGASGKAGAVCDADCPTMPALFVEWDDKPIEWQISAWRELQLPEPSAIVLTGGKSAHAYWVLSEPMPSDQWRVLQRQLLEHCDADRKLCNPSRVMRLPGFRYIDKATGKPGQLAELLHTSTARYSPADLEAYLAALLELPTATPDTSAPPPPHRGDLPPRGIEQIEEAASYIPQRVVGQNTYETSRRALCGCAAALAEISHPDPEGQALALLASKWPDYGTAKQALVSSTTREAATFWAIAAEHGYNTRRRDLKQSHSPLGGGTNQRPAAPATFAALVKALPVGWIRKVNRDGEEVTVPSKLSPGYLAQLLTDSSGQLRFNLMDLRAEVLTTSGWQRITDADMDSAYVLLSAMGWIIGIDPLIKAVIHVARQVEVHPVREYLERVAADPIIAPFDLDQVAPQFFRAAAPLYAAMVRKWLVGAVARALQPGCQMDYCLVFKGEQGQRKSRQLEALASKEWHCSTIPEQEKDLLLNVHSTWIYELAELESVTSRKEAGRLKNLITTSIDNMRPPYGRTAERLPRQSVFAATVNEETFLRDDTGNRRFWVVPIEGSDQLDQTGLIKARDGIWKAAVIAHRNGELPMLPPELEALSAAQNAEFNQQDPWVEMVRAWMDGSPLQSSDPNRDPNPLPFDPSTPFTSAEVLYSAGLKQPAQITRADEMRIAAVLRQMGFKRGKQKRVDGQVVRPWELSQPSQPSQPQPCEVVTPQDPCAGMDLATKSQPSQPQIEKGGVNGCVADAWGLDRSHGVFAEGGCDTRQNQLKPHVPQTVSASQPHQPKVVTTPEVVTAMIGSGADAFADDDDPTWGPRPSAA